MIEFAKGHRGVRRVLGDLVAGEQGYTNLKKKLLKSALLPLLVVTLFAAFANNASAQRVKHRSARQPAEVIKAYRVCNQFQQLLAQDLDFDRAFEATFTRDQKRRRAIAIGDGEFDAHELATVDDATLIDAFKSRMEVFYLMSPLFGPDNSEQEELFFPPAIKARLERKGPENASEFPAFAAQLKREAVDFRNHLNQLAASHPEVVERIRDFKKVLMTPLEQPTTVVRPLTAYSHGQVLPPNAKYYQIGSYAVIREQGQMKIIGIRFFTRLF